ncbi:MAG: hypothetical protein ACXWQO_02720 [Bdellovibrionota bacterium]
MLSWKNEKRDLLDLLLCFSALIFFWLVLGWRPGITFSRQDGFQFFYSAMHIVRDAGRGLDGPAYDPYILGGSKFSAAWISPWFTKVLLLAKLKITNIVFLSVIFPQIFHGFLSLKLMDGIIAWKGTKPEPRLVLSILETIAWAVLFTFPPWAWQ